MKELNELLYRVEPEEFVKNIYGIGADAIKNIIEQVDFEYAKVISTELNKISDELPTPILNKFTPEIVLNLCRDIGRISQMEEYLDILEKSLDISCDYIANIMPFDVNELVGTDYLYTKNREKMKKYFIEKAHGKDKYIK